MGSGQMAVLRVGRNRREMYNGEMGDEPIPFKMRQLCSIIRPLSNAIGGTINSFRDRPV